jgi:drug/metabolite transporter (DMT)-like permease
MSEEKWTEVWRDQPAGGAPIDVRLLERRGSELETRTRREILASIAAAMLFVAVIAWRFASMYRRIPSLGLAAALAWALITLLWFRARLRGSAVASPGATGVEHYRHELERRRDHLRNIWIWNGPLLAACITLVAVLDSPFAMQRLAGVAPLLIALVAWAIYGIVRRRRQANELQREIDELGS